MPTWLIASLGYVLAVGLVGITTKVALRYVPWPVLLVATTLAYLILTVVVLARQGFGLPPSPKSWLGPVIATGVLIAGSFVLFLLAVERADVSRVIPITASYPIVAALAAAMFLTESVSLAQIAGIGLIVSGAILVAR